MKKLIFVLVFILVGCNSNVPEEFLVRVNAFAAQTTETENLIGFYVTDSSAFSTISQTNKSILSHDIYGFEMDIRGQIPVSSLLQCYMYNKTPILNIYFDEQTKPTYTKTLDLALDLHNLNIPVIINLAPFSSNNWGDFDSYKKIWEDMSTTLKRFAPKVILVWSIYHPDAPVISKAMPNESTFDYTGLIYYGQGEEGTEQFFNSLNYVYNSCECPVFISALGISHYSTKDHSYKINETAETLTTIYETVGTEYPKVCAIIYMDKNLTQGVPTSVICSNYSVSTDSTLLNNYVEVAKKYNSIKKSNILFDGLETSDKL